MADSFLTITIIKMKVIDIRSANPSEVIRGLLVTYQMNIIFLVKFITTKLSPNDVMCVNEATNETYTAKDIIIKIYSIITYCEERQSFQKRKQIQLLTIKEILNGTNI